MCEKQQYRLFFSYPRNHLRNPQRMVDVLSEKLDLEVYWDGNITPGNTFIEEIKGFISISHIFAFIVVEGSECKPWTNQELGFALAKNIPLLIIIVKDSDSSTDGDQHHSRDDMGPKLREMLGMASSHQCIFIQEDFSNLEAEKKADLEDSEAEMKKRADLQDLEAKMKKVNLEKLVHPMPPRPTLQQYIAQWPEKRTELLAEYSNREIMLGHFGCIRQKATFSSFHLPSSAAPASIWTEIDGNMKKSKYYQYLLSEEHRILEIHARSQGCRLIIDLSNHDHSAGILAVRKRLEGLLNFVENFPDQKPLNIAISEIARRSNVTIVGNWFAAISERPDPEGYRNTTFYFHAPTVLQKIKQFDTEFHDIQIQNDVHLADKDTKGYKNYAIEKITEAIEKINANIDKDEKEASMS